MTYYQVVTDIIIKRLEKGEIPWRSPFRGSGIRCANYQSKKSYRGFNALITASLGFKSPYFLTFNQIRKTEGAKLIKGSKGAQIARPIKISKEVDGKTKESLIFSKTYVFNLDQVEGIDCPVVAKIDAMRAEAPDFVDMEPCEKFLMNIKPRIAPFYAQEMHRAYYQPGMDLISIATKDNFKTEEDFYSTLFHEIGHSTGHSSRLKRDLTGQKPSPKYAREELIAEISASFMCAHTGILNRTVENHASYLASWLKALKDDPKMILKASSEAEKVMDYLIPEKDDTDNTHQKV